MGNEDFRSIQAIKSRLLQALADLDYVSTLDADFGPRSGRRRIGDGETPDDIQVSGLAAIARRLLKQSNGRSDYFDPGLFADPAWHMLLELFTAAAESREISVGTLSQASGVPATTALRWIRDLEGRGLVERMPDHQDGRRAYIRISAEAFANMAAYLARISDLEHMVSSAPAVRLPRRRLRD